MVSCVSVALMIAVAGCKSTSSLPRVGEQEPPPGIASPEALTAAAEAVKHLDALIALHSQGVLAGAAQIVERLRKPGPDNKPLVAVLDDIQRFSFYAIALDLALAAGDKAEIKRLTSLLQPVTAAQHFQAARIRARAFGHIDNPGAAAIALIEGIEWETSGDLSELTTAIWRWLSKLPVLELDNFVKSAPTPAARVWGELARHFNGALTSGAQASIWEQWQAWNPRHAAVRFPPASVQQLAANPDDIALLIPLSGDLNAAATAIRDGFMTAYLHSEPLAQTVRVYDTGALAVEEAVRRATADGADVIVGPLEKSAVARVAALAPPLPVVVLNNPDSKSTPGGGILQLALAVEDQASAIAMALAADGVKRIVLFANARRWSTRARVRIKAELGAIETVGLGILDGVEEVTTIAGDALGVTASTTRHEELSKLLGTKLEFTPRRRDNVDAVVALVDGPELLALKPALDFHFAGGLPVYVPAPAMRGVGLGRLTGVRVCDVPWRLHPSALRAEAMAAFPANREVSTALFALGVDGFRIANQLGRLMVHGESIAGSTGVLTLAGNGRIHRALAWAAVRDGRLAPLTKRALAGD